MEFKIVFLKLKFTLFNSWFVLNLTKIKERINIPDYYITRLKITLSYTTGGP